MREMRRGVRRGVGEEEARDGEVGGQFDRRKLR